MNISRFQNIYLNTKPQANNELFNMKVEDMTFSTLLKNKSNSNLRADNMSKNANARRFNKPNMEKPKQFLQDDVNNTARAKISGSESYRNEKMTNSQVTDIQNVAGEEILNRSELSQRDAFKKMEDVKALIKKLESLESEQPQEVNELLAAIGQISALLEEMQAELDLEALGFDEISALLENVELLQNADLSAQELQALSEMAAKLQEGAEKFSEILEQHRTLSQGQNVLDESLVTKIEELLEELNVHSVDISQIKKIDIGTKALTENADLDANALPEEAVEEEVLRVQNQNNQANVGAYTERETAKSTSDEVSIEENALEDFKNVMEITNRDLKSVVLEKAGTLLHKSTSTHEIYSQIKEGMSKLDINGNLHEIVIKLKPEELGKVELKLELYKDFIIAKFDVENQAVKEAIESNLKDLRSSLEQSGYNNMQFDVNVGTGGQEAPKQAHFTRKRAQSDIELNEGIQGVNTRKSLNSIVEETSFEYLA